MGVKDLWKLLEPAGRPIRVESLEGLVLAVDVSIWLNQAVKGMRDRQGEPIPNAHLIVLFHRICKLLFYRIKPIFIFDGATPLLKQQTLTKRQRKRSTASQRSTKAANKQVSKFLQAKILEQVTGEKSRVSVPPVPSGSSHRREADMFELPPLPENALKGKEDSLDLVEPISLAESAHYYGDLMSVDIHSESFNDLPPEVQHELLLERQQLEKYSHHQPASLPQVAQDFSNYQLSRLLLRSKTSKKLEGVRKVLKSSDTALVGLGDDSRVHEVESQRIVSSESAHYILVKGTDIESQSSASQTDEDTASQSETELSGARRYPITGKKSVQKLKESSLNVVFDSRAKDLNSGDVEDDRIFIPGKTVSEAVSFGDMGVISDSSESDGEFQSFEGQLTLFENIRASVRDPSSHDVESDGGDGDLCKDAMHESKSFEVTTSLTPNPESLSPLTSPSSPSIPKARPSPPPNVIPPSPPTPNMKLMSSSTFNMEPSSPSTSNVNISPSSTPLMISIECGDMDNTVVNKVTHEPTTEPTNEGKEMDTNKLGEAARELEEERPNEEDVVVIGNSSRDEVAHVVVDDTSKEQSGKAHWSGGEEIEELVGMDARLAQNLLGQEAKELDQQRTRQSRAAASVSNQMYKDAQELMSLFGLPYIVAPSEAEAQCAALEENQLTQGSITDDNDIFLFGGEIVYRNFFSQDKELEVYCSTDIQQKLGLSRDKLIVLAYLLSSDYTEGIEGVGAVSAMEILRDFPGKGLKILTNLKEWHREVNLKPPLHKNESKLQKKLRECHLAADFPSELVWEAYHHPEVDDSKDPFEWAKPDLDLLRSFAESRIGWKEEKVNEVLLPVLKKMNAKDSTQTKVTQFFTKSTAPQSTATRGKAIKSRRIRNAIARIRDQPPEVSSSKASSSRGGKKRSKRISTRTQPGKKLKVDTKIKQSQLPSSRPTLSASSSSSSNEE